MYVVSLFVSKYEYTKYEKSLLKETYSSYQHTTHKLKYVVGSFEKKNEQKNPPFMLQNTKRYRNFPTPTQPPLKFSLFINSSVCIKDSAMLRIHVFLQIFSFFLGRKVTQKRQKL